MASEEQHTYCKSSAAAYGVWQQRRQYVAYATNKWGRHIGSSGGEHASGRETGRKNYCVDGSPEQRPWSEKAYSDWRGYPELWEHPEHISGEDPEPGPPFFKVSSRVE